MDGSTAHRIIVLGSSCSGKSTLAQRLADSLNAPFVELDAIHWRPGWTSTPDDEFRGLVEAATSGDTWVVAGNYRRITQPTIWPRTDLFVWLDLPLSTTLRRMVRRTWRRWRTRELLWGTNVEDPWQHLRLWEYDKNLFTYTVLYHRSRRAEYARAMADPRWAHARWVRLRSPAEIEAFARDFEGQAAGDHRKGGASP
ncbi:MAG: adenylate kinase [Dehalococcoidia bacterium]